MNRSALANIGVRLEAPGATPHTEALRGVASADDLDAPRERNARRLREAQEQLGDKWLLARPRRIKEAA